MTHHDHIPRYPGGLAELAGELGDLRYDALADFLRALADKLDADSAADAGRGRLRLAAALREASAGVGTAADAIGRAWAVSAPYMPDG